MKRGGYLFGVITSMLFFSCTSNDSSDEFTAPLGEVDVVLSNKEVVQEYLNIDIENLPVYTDETLPEHYGKTITDTDNTPDYNPITDQGATLGRVLFYDTNLSVNNTVSCASCHNQSNGFTDNAKFSQGFNGEVTGANSMSLANIRYFEDGEMFWDRRAGTLEEQVLMPIQDSKEMGFDGVHANFEGLIERLESLDYYPILFEEMFGEEIITEDRISAALAQFVRSLVSADSRFDRGYAANYDKDFPEAALYVEFTNFTAEENRGKELFMNFPDTNGLGCVGCHQGPSFGMRKLARSNGLDAGESTEFKVPSLKNVELGAPYMHDGRFETLEEVVEHYNSGIQDGPALDIRLKDRDTREPLKFNMSEEDKQAVVAFLKTLTDETFVTDPRFSDPFKIME